MNWLKFDDSFNKEIMDIFYYGYEYGVNKSNFESIEEIKKDEKTFYGNSHEGFDIAQKKILKLLTQLEKMKSEYRELLKEIRRNRKKKEEEICKYNIKLINYQEKVVRKLADGIAWQLIGFDHPKIRRLCVNDQPTQVRFSNIESLMDIIDDYNDDPLKFALIADITSFIHIGDIMLINRNDGIISFIEVKEGEVNAKIFDGLKKSYEMNCPRVLLDYINQDKHKFKQTKRILRQFEKNETVITVFNKGEGIDYNTKKRYKAFNDPTEINDYSSNINKILNECDEKDWAIDNPDPYLFFGAYQYRFPGERIFEDWLSTFTKDYFMVNVVNSVNHLVGKPIFISGFNKSNIFDIVLLRKKLFIGIHFENVISYLSENGIDCSYLSLKETRRYENQNKINPFKINDRAINVSYNDDEFVLLWGLMSRVVFEFMTIESLYNMIKRTFDEIDKEKEFDKKN